MDSGSDAGGVVFFQRPVKGEGDIWRGGEGREGGREGWGRATVCVTGPFTGKKCTYIYLPEKMKRRKAEKERDNGGW